MRINPLFAVVLPMLVASSPRAEAPASAPLPPLEAPKHMALPPGFTATLFAGEPDVVQPIATAFDDRGRLWVAECLSYPNWVSDPKQGHDRIIIFEDQHGDGHFSKKTLFADNIANISGLEIGFGGVWVCASPNLLFIPIDPSGDKPAGQPKVILDGWDIKTAEHNVFNRIVWGPDGWLYGCNGIQSKSNVGKPGAPDTERTPMNCGVWRYHPTRHVFEVVAHGTTNPWGLDFDDYGATFITNCVIEHLWHVIPGAHYKRMYGEDFDKHVYGLMQTCADHLHWAGGAWTDSRGGVGAHGAAGGGHAHAGCMIYLGDNWPVEYRNNVFMCNIHGNRVNRDILEEKASGYVAHHGHDFLLANDPWFRGLNLVYGPDGGVYVNDWTDTGECHNHVVVDRTNGRIYKVVYGDQPKPLNVNLAAASDEELVSLQLHKNDWYVRHARRLLQERAAAGKLSAGTAAALMKIFNENPDVTRKLRALWALYGISAKDAVPAAIASDEPHIKSWGLRLMVDGEQIPEDAGQRLADAARSDLPAVRLAVASALQRVPVTDRLAALMPLVHRAADADDPNLPLMIWYAAEPVIDNASPVDFDSVLAGIRIPLLREYSARLFAERDVADATWVVGSLVTHPGEGGAAAIRAAAVLDFLRGVQTALKDQRQVTAPRGWSETAAKLAENSNAEVRRRALLLSLTFGLPDAQAAVRKYARDAAAPVNERREALAALIQAQPKDLGPFLRELLDDKDLGDMAIRALAAAGDQQTPTVLLDHYASFSPQHRRDAVATLASRPAWAIALLDAVEAGKVPMADMGALVVRQLQNLKDRAVDARVKKLWGAVRQASQDKVSLMLQYRAELAPDALKKADLPHGRLVFNNTCAACHVLFDSGGDVGPNLTGSQRANLDYVLENVLDPSAIVAKEYLMTVVQTTDGRVLTGIIKQETDSALVLKMPNETATVQKSDIKSRKTDATTSMMPEGLFQALSPDDRRDLVAYLASPNQVPLTGGK